MTQPLDRGSAAPAHAIVVEATYTDPNTGALYVHKDLTQVRADWDTEAHIPPVRADERFGDVDSWAAYVQRFAAPTDSLLTWNAAGLYAVLDYHDSNGPVGSGRCQWKASYLFPLSRQWKTWATFAAGQAHGQKEAVEALEDMADDIREPADADVAGLLRLLRSYVQASASTELRPDGTSTVNFTRDERVSGSGEIPGYLVIAIPVFAGGEPWEVKVRLRLSVGNDGKLGLRFSRSNAEAVLETAIAERVDAARMALGDTFTLLRAAG